MTTPTREQVARKAFDNWKPESAGIGGPSYWSCWIAARADLEATIAEQAKEIERLQDGLICGDCDGSGWLENRVEGRYPCTCMTEAEPYQLLERQLAEAQATNKALRGALKTCHGYDEDDGAYHVQEFNGEKVVAAIALPNDDTALRAELAKVYEECAQVCEALKLKSDKPIHDENDCAEAIHDLAKQKLEQ